MLLPVAAAAATPPTQPAPPPKGKGFQVPAPVRAEHEAPV